MIISWNKNLVFFLFFVSSLLHLLPPHGQGGGGGRSDQQEEQEQEELLLRVHHDGSRAIAAADGDAFQGDAGNASGDDDTRGGRNQVRKHKARGKRNITQTVNAFDTYCFTTFLIQGRFFKKYLARLTTEAEVSTTATACHYEVPVRRTMATAAAAAAAVVPDSLTEQSPIYEEMCSAAAVVR